MKRKLLFMLTIAASFTIPSSFAIAQEATLLGQFDSWAALTHTDATGTYCFATSTPEKYEPESNPPEARHGKVIFFVTNRPNDGIRQEPSVTVGYNFKQDSSVTVDVDGKSFEMYTHDDSAWLDAENKQLESQLIQAMKDGNSVIVSGESFRGTKTKYTFSLKGVTAAINAIDKNCS